MNGSIWKCFEARRHLSPYFMDFLLHVLTPDLESF